MADDRPKAERNAGMFLGPGGPFPAVIRPDTDDLRDAPPEPEDPDQPVPATPRQGLVDRLLGRNPPPPRER